MNKKIFGVRLGTILSVIGCFVAAVLFWLFVKYSESGSSQSIALIDMAFRGV